MKTKQFLKRLAYLTLLFTIAGFVASCNDGDETPPPPTKPVTEDDIKRYNAGPDIDQPTNSINKSGVNSRGEN